MADNEQNSYKINLFSKSRRNIILIILSILFYITFFGFYFAIVGVILLNSDEHFPTFLEDFINKNDAYLLLIIFFTVFLVSIIIFILIIHFISNKKFKAIYFSITIHVVSCFLTLLIINSNVYNQALTMQVAYRDTFFKDMKQFDDYQNVSELLNNTQTKFKCCGFNEARDYKEFFKPESCCNETNVTSVEHQRCLNPPRQMEGNLGESPNYYLVGCAKEINFIIKNYFDNLRFYVILCAAFMAACILTIMLINCNELTFWKKKNYESLPSNSKTNENTTDKTTHV